MKQFLTCFSVVVLGFLLVVLSALMVGRRQSYANDATQSSLHLQASPAVFQQQLADLEATQAGTSLEVSYYLPYPGILPDHPLYPIKMLRDRIALWFSVSKDSKFDRVMLYADKRVGAAGVLVSGNKLQLGVRTAVKAQGYLLQAYELARELNHQEKLDQVKASAYKHQMILEEIKANLGTMSHDQINLALDTNKQVIDSFPQVIEDTETQAAPENGSDSKEFEQPVLEEEFLPVEIGL